MTDDESRRSYIDDRAAVMYEANGGAIPYLDCQKRAAAEWQELQDVQKSLF